MYPFIIALAILPGLLISYYIFRLDRYEEEPRIPLLISFALGMVLTIPAIYLEKMAVDWGWQDPESLWLTLLFAFVGVSLVEEFFKFSGLLIFPFRQSFFNEPMDGIVYSVMIGMGFATLENILYADRFGLETVLVRALTAVPAHASFAIMMGYFAGLAKFDRKNRWKLLLKGFALTVAVHGGYDFFIEQQLYNWLIIWAIVILFVAVHFARRLVLEHVRQSPFREPEEPDGSA
ncbi:MAG: PrsW family intramembrane metalloprotease [Saprospiraceae bacterium]|nr:PrsW family intramembrane metalloprotease [Saprospiraceae bacterium]MCB0624670.1 PrsW family intramembrane metalloprotease [Saprospiraceae bacterium]MCB0676532.1 PrsW family intramembrane metalloprotease [Saprospiraceae bacterium]MCB0681838.1 PrsW family intramembrane metalloprotease [Saprospiraceae bacterium]